MTAAYGSSGSFGSIVSSKSIGHNTYTGIISNLHSKATPINVPVHKSDLDYSYSIIRSSKFPQAAAKKLIYCLSHKFSYASKIIDPVINGFSPNDKSSHLHIVFSCILF